MGESSDLRFVFVRTRVGSSKNWVCGSDISDKSQVRWDIFEHFTGITTDAKWSTLESAFLTSLWFDSPRNNQIHSNRIWAAPQKLLTRTDWGTYCWWLKSGVHQLRLAIDPTIYRGLSVPGGAGFQPSTVFFHTILFDWAFLLFHFLRTYFLRHYSSGIPSHFSWYFLNHHI